MTLRCLEIDFVSLPEALLCSAKSQCRIEFDRDDNFIKTAIARAIGEVEAATGLSIFNQLWEWDLTDFATTPRFPKSPVRRVMTDDGTGTWTDYTAVKLGDPFYFGPSYFTEPYANQVYRFEAGYNALNCLPPALMNIIILITGNIYENRESVQQGTMYELPDITRRMLSGLWLPSA